MVTYIDHTAPISVMRAVARWHAEQAEHFRKDSDYRERHENIAAQIWKAIERRYHEW